jgi:hypothetical protein
MADSTLTDPLGRRIRLPEQTWLRHILKRHPEMISNRGAVENALSNPLEIRFHPSDPDSRLYYGESGRTGIMILVVADVSIRFVKTAHFVRQTKGTIEWLKPTQ